MKNYYTGLLCLFLLGQVLALDAAILKGRVQNNKGEPLAFALVYVQGTTIGTTTNQEGEYSLELPQREQQIVYKYVGFKQEVFTINIVGESILKNVTLYPLDFEVEEVMVIGGEDPAYPIMRKAIKKRKYYLHQKEEYSCDAYVKGVQHITDLPNKIMGRSLDKLRQGLDSTGSGIVYLSESVSKLYYTKNTYKEIMISSKVSGDDHNFSFNSGAAMSELNFYENQITLGDSKLLSPIAQNALLFYKYQLINTFEDGGRLVNKIKVIPKNKLGQLFQGEIYIVEDEWCIHSATLRTTGKAANISMLDTIEFRQMYLPVQDSIWRLFSQEIDFKIQIFSIKLAGRFTGIFHHYNLQPNFGEKMFGAEVFKVDETANQKDSTYWKSIRPVPLTIEEEREYNLKDSLQQIWKSKAYQDSVDRVSNRPSLGMFFTGYQYRNSYRKWQWRISSPLTSIQFNSVQGWHGHLETNFLKELQEDYAAWFDIHAAVEYGLADRQFRGYGRFRYKFNDVNDAQLNVEAGRRSLQYAGQILVDPTVNSLYSLLRRCNYSKLYEKRYFRTEYKQRVWNGVLLVGQLEYAERHSLINHTNYGWGRRDGWVYFSNAPLDFDNPPLPNLPTFSTNRQLKISVLLRLRLKQKFISYPNRKFYISSSYPDIWLHYAKALPILGADMDYDYLGLTIQKEEWTIGTIGLLTARIKLAFFPNQNRMEFMDYSHFYSNQTLYAKSGQHWHSYQLMPYYQFSSNQWFTEAHLQHDFNGVIWNKIPLLKHLGFEFVAGYHFLYTAAQGDYMEFTLGLDRLGWNWLRFGRIDVVTSYQSGALPKFGVVFGLDFSL